MLKRKNNEEVIQMEQTTFIQKHAKKILIAGGLVVTAGAAFILHKHDIEIAEHAKEIFNLKKRLNVNTEIAIKALQDTIDNYDFEIEELIFRRDNLDASATQNIFINIPKINEEIELKTKLRDNAIGLLKKAIENGETE